MNGKRPQIGLGAYPKPFSMSAIIQRGDVYNALLREGRDPKLERDQNIADPACCATADGKGGEAQGGHARQPAGRLRAHHDSDGEGRRDKHLRQASGTRSEARLLPETLRLRPIGEISRDELFDAMAPHVEKRRETADKGWTSSRGRGSSRRARGWWMRPPLTKSPTLPRTCASRNARAHRNHRAPDFVNRLRTFDRADAMTCG